MAPYTKKRNEEYWEKQRKLRKYNTNAWFVIGLLYIFALIYGAFTLAYWLSEVL